MQIPAISKPFKLGKSSGATRRFQDNLTIILSLLPALILFLVFVVYPIVQSVYYSMFNWKGFGPATDFVGLENFKNILTDKVFSMALRNGLIIIGFSLLLQLPLSMMLAVLVGRDLPGRVLYRTVFFMPYVVSEVTAALMWLFLFNPDPERGFLNALIVLIPNAKTVAWLGDPKVVMNAVFMAMTWKYFGFHMLLYLTGLQNIPNELEEAAKIDGANSIESFFYITFPLLRSTIQTSVYMSVLGSIQQFVLVWIMTKGGPVNASETMATYMYRFGFVRFQLGYGSAVALYMFLFCLIFSLIYQRLTRQPDYFSGL